MIELTIAYAEDPSIVGRVLRVKPQYIVTIEPSGALRGSRNAQAAVSMITGLTYIVQESPDDIAALHKQWADGIDQGEANPSPRTLN